MQTRISPQYQNTPEGQEAEAILRKCVHCGFCTATCPTYQLLGDELDGPRGRIYLIKQVLEGTPPSRSTQIHLDRCLTCRNCETTCPSGVEYGKLIDIGRQIVEDQVPRPLVEKALRVSLREGVPSPLMQPAMRIGQGLRHFLPAVLKSKLPQRRDPGSWPHASHARKVLLMANCVQPGSHPVIDTATARVLDAAGIQLLKPALQACCGAVKYHLNDQKGGRGHMRAQIDSWWPLLESGAIEAIVSNVSGCGLMAKEYGHALQHDPVYAAKAAKVSSVVKDLSELLPDIVHGLQESRGHAAAANLGQGMPLNYHPPCTLQHGQRLKTLVPDHLRQLGFDIRMAEQESHLCCGSAGTYSLTQPALARQLRDRKLQHLAFRPAHAIVSANVGCIMHLQSGTETPVRHWLEMLDEALLRPAA